MTDLTIAYITGRKEPQFWWFISSLRRQVAGKFDNIRIVVVDYWCQPLPWHKWTERDVTTRKHIFQKFMPDVMFRHVPPKPTPWQGPHRRTKLDYFAPANSRNTAILHAGGTHIAYVDDLSVLMPTWYTAVQEACKNNRIVAGAFLKMKDMFVDKGLVRYYRDFAPGRDSRWKDGNDTKAVECPPRWTFGCSLVAPIERFLEINGWPEDCDSTGLGMEDCHVGIAFGNNGHKVYYDRRMLTYESEDHHYQQPMMVRMDKSGAGIMEPPGLRPNEKGHHFVVRFENAKRFANYFGEGGIAAMRMKVLTGQKVDYPVLPEHDWFDSQPLSEL